MLNYTCETPKLEGISPSLLRYDSQDEELKFTLVSAPRSNLKFVLAEGQRNQSVARKQIYPMTNCSCVLDMSHQC